MANLSIKNLPDSVHKDLKQAAAAQGRSLNSFVVRALERIAEEDLRSQSSRVRWERLHALIDSLPPVGDSAELIREDRDHGH